MNTTGAMRSEKRSAPQQVADALSERILSGAFLPGSRLRESAVAAELGVARNTVREAVRILEKGGLIRHIANRGATVNAPTVEGVTELYVARERLEVAAVSMVPTEGNLVRLEAAYRDIERLSAKDSAVEAVTRDLAFHSAIVAMLQSQRLSDYFESLVEELRYYLIAMGNADREHEDSAQLQCDHKMLLDSILSGDPSTAADAVRLHIRKNAARVLEILRFDG